MSSLPRPDSNGEEEGVIKAHDRPKNHTTHYVYIQYFGIFTTRYVFFFLDRIQDFGNDLTAVMRPGGVVQVRMTAEHPPFPLCGHALYRLRSIKHKPTAVGLVLR